MISLSNFCGKFFVYTCIYLSMCPLEEMGASHYLEKIRIIQIQEFALLPGTILNRGLPEYPHEHLFYTKFCGKFLTQACIYLSVCALEDMGTSNHLENLVQQETEGSSQDCDAHFDPASLATRIGTTKHSSRMIS